MSHSFCSGSQRVIEAVQSVQTVVTVDILAQPGGQSIGAVVAEPTVREEWQTAEYLSS